jgi:hypothetical protein
VYEIPSSVDLGIEFIEILKGEGLECHRNFGAAVFQSAMMTHNDVF